jgi:hypothetical protein
MLLSYRPHISENRQCASSPATDGQRFLMSTVTETRTPAITVVLNWKPGAAER